MNLISHNIIFGAARYNIMLLLYNRKRRFKKLPIKASISQKANTTCFDISNANLQIKNAINAKHSGVGLSNLKNNLNLVYPDKHQLTISENEDIFKVILNLTDEAQNQNIMLDY